MQNRFHLLAANIALLFVIALFCLVIMELALRLAGISHVTWYKADEILGYSLMENARGWHRDENTTYVRINSDGMRDTELTDKDETAKRIVWLGDSFTEAFQVELSNTFYAVATDTVRNCTESPVESYNFGVGGHGTAQQLLMYESRAKQLQPDIVVLALFTGNDLRNNVEALENDPLRPYFLEGQDTLIHDTSFLTEPAFTKKKEQIGSMRLRNRFVILQGLSLLKQNVTDAIRVRLNIPSVSAQSDETQWSEQGIGDWIYLPPKTTHQQSAWAITEKLIIELKNQVESSGATFVLTVFGPGIEVHPDAEIRNGYIQSIGAQNLAYATNRLEQLALRENFAIIPLQKILREYAEKNTLYVHSFDQSGKGHWNTDGHAIAGQKIGAEICTYSVTESW